MAEHDATPASKPSWHEREISQALSRLATARATLAQLEEQEQAAAPKAEPDPADVARAEELQHEIERLTAKAGGRFGAAAAKAKLADRQGELRLVLERLGVARLEDLSADDGAPTVAAVDPAVLEFARRECADAEHAFLEVTAMVIPEAEPEPDEPDAEVIAAGSFAEDTELDLRAEPSAS